MGLFSEIGDFLGDVVDGVVDFVDDALGIDLVKILDNDFVKYGLMAASLFTGGVAIVNGVIQGAGAAASAQGFMAKFVEGAVGFVKGVASGIANPMKTAGNLLDDAGNLMSGSYADMTGHAGKMAQDATSASMDMLADGGDIAGNVAEDALGSVDPDAMLTDAGVDEALGASTPDFSLAEMARAGDPGVNAPIGVEGGIYQPRDGVQPSGFSLGGAWDGIKEAGGDFLSKMWDGTQEFASSPAGLQTIAGMAQGYAQGAAIEERWKMMQEEEERRRRSWDGFSGRTRTNLANVPSLRDLRARSREMAGRGNQAQGAYGY
jgi:hypothetical protein